MAKAPQVGELAPDFTLPGVENGETRSYTLSQQRGRPVVLAFYPGDESTVCTKQLCSYQSDVDVFAGFDAIVWGISPQGLESHARFAQRRGLTFPLLADTDRAVHSAYGANTPLLTKRALYVVDAGGVVRHRHFSLTGIRYEDTDTIAAVLRSLQPA